MKSVRKYLLDLKQIWIFSTHFHKSLQHWIRRKSVKWEPPWYKVERRADLMKVIGALCDCANAPKKHELV